MMKLNKTARLRCGLQARFFDYGNNGGDWPLVGVIAGRDGVDAWQQDGKWNYFGEHPLDIITMGKAMEEVTA